MASDAINNRLASFGALNVFEYTNTIWRLKQRKDAASFDDMLNPIFWADVAHKLHACDLIYVMPEDASYFAILLVRVVEQKAAKVHVLSFENFEVKKVDPLTLPEVPDGYEVKFVGASRGWCVRRKADNEILFEKGKDEVAARGWLTTHLQRLA